MHKGYLITAVSFFACVSTPASAALFNFSQGGYADGATVVGSFVGTDSNSDGQISAFDGEVTDFSAAFSGNSLVSALAFDFSDLFGLVYDLDGDIGDGITLDVEGISAVDGVTGYSTGPGPLALCDGINTCGSVTDAEGVSETTELVLVTQGIPEPATWVMMLIGFGAVGYGMRREKTGQRVSQRT